MKKLLALGAAVVALSGGIALAAGIFPGFPIMFGSSYCNAYSIDGKTCASTIPAGPTQMSGNEQIPGDTEIASGVPPQTVVFTPPTLAQTTMIASTFTAGSSVTVPNSVYIYDLYQNGTIASAAITLPANPANNQSFTLYTSSTVTSVAVSPNAGQSMNLGFTGNTGLTAAGTYRWVYQASNTTWYRVQ